MDESHIAYLSLGSNIQPEINLVRGIQLLQEHGRIIGISNAWESKSVGADGPNYLNACVSYITPLDWPDLKEKIILPIELQLGRKRTENKFAPRTMDIDIILFDGKSCDDKSWEKAFVVVPLAEIIPTYQNPLRNESIQETAARLRRQIWMESRPLILSQPGSNRLQSSL
ncbi:MAG: 2-amino-4-hydroxy-6-hydroxymethyldihydropteridine diphosphokinase [Bacteroidota bacterium]